MKRFIKPFASTPILSLSDLKPSEVEVKAREQRAALKLSLQSADKAAATAMLTKLQGKCTLSAAASLASNPYDAMQAVIQADIMRVKNVQRG